MRETVIAVLEGEGYAVFGACNGRVALDSLEAAAPDVIVLDVTMPELSGPGFLAALRSTRWACRPVVLVTADRHVDDLPVAHRLPKPFDLEDLLGAVQDALRPRA